MKFNETKKSEVEKQKTENFEGGEAFVASTPEVSLYKVVINNLLEDTYYEEDTESLKKVKKRFNEVAKSNPEFPLKLAEYARTDMYLRDISQVLLVLSANHKKSKEFVKKWSPKIIQRADEPQTCIAIQLELFGKPIPKPLKKGISKSLHQFDEYQFSKYSSERKRVSMVDVFNLVHPKPKNEEEEKIFERIIKGPMDNYEDVKPLEPPRTWEVTLSEKGNTAEAWREVLPKMGLFAKIRNLRNMIQKGLDGKEILGEEDMDHVRHSKIYPFRFYQAYNALKEELINDSFTEEWLSKAVDVSSENLPDYLENTFVAVDLSGSMRHPVSNRSELYRTEIASLFGGILMRKEAKIGAFAEKFGRITAHKDTPALELSEKIKEKGRELGGSTNGWKAMRYLTENDLEFDRVIFLTDEQLWDSTWGSESTLREEFNEYREKVKPETNLYIIDLASYGQLSMPEGYKNVYQISGWNENVIDFIDKTENIDELISEIESREP